VASNCVATNALYAARSLSIEPSSPFLKAKQNEWIQGCARAIPYLHTKEGSNQFCGDVEKQLQTWQNGGLLGDELYMCDYLLLAVMSQSGLYGKKSTKIK